MFFAKGYRKHDCINRQLFYRNDNTTQKWNHPKVIEFLNTNSTKYRHTFGNWSGSRPSCESLQSCSNAWPKPNLRRLIWHIFGVIFHSRHAYSHIVCLYRLYSVLKITYHSLQQKLMTYFLTAKFAASKAENQHHCYSLANFS